MKLGDWKFCLLLFQLMFLTNVCLSDLSFNPYKWPVNQLRRVIGAVKVTNTSNYFGFSLYENLNSNGNVFISPYSLASVMAMLYLGARGVTKNEMDLTLGYNSVNLNSEDLVLGFQQSLLLLNAESKEYQLETANSLMIQNTFNILDNYKRMLEDKFGANVQDVDFINKAELVQRYINAWVAFKTKNKIPILLNEPLKPETRLAFFNAVYFKGVWETKFDSALTRRVTFYNNGYVPTQVPMMMLRGIFPFAYVSSLRSYVLELPYKGHEVSMLLLLPKDRNGISDLERDLSSSSLDSVTSNLREIGVLVTVPKFKLEETYEDDLKQSLESMGMTSLFSEANANLEGITGHRDLFVTKITHRTLIEVNEEGTEASGISSVVAGVRSGWKRPTFTADHPFVFFIRHNRSGIILFMGRVSQL
ncbi:intracellular coagulation inhibitor 1 [Tachypleus tridentatus]|uniref:intracellular coagulation inhibitor 1 n=1 Tax=Tachypleus tridentatus TaxID=6853 RepID=UPI003FD44C36